MSGRIVNLYRDCADCGGIGDLDTAWECRTCKGHGVLHLTDAECRIFDLFPRLLQAAEEVMADLAEYGPSIVGHLMDTDQNAGQRLRDAIAEAKSGGAL